MLRRQLQTIPETIGDFDRAAECRYWDGCELLIEGHALGGIYLLGYAAEMILKHACLRANNGRPADLAGGFFGPVRSWMRARYPLVDRENYHSLVFWSTYLRAWRRHAGSALPDDLDWQLVRRVRRLYAFWSVDLRYRDWTIATTEAQIVYDDVTWLRDRRLQLWK